MERLTEKRDGQNVIPLRQNGKIKWAICSAGLGDAPTEYLYGDHADRLAAIEDILGDEYDLNLVQRLIQAYKEGRYIIMKEPEQAGVSHLRELAQADRDGRCVVQKFAPGSEVWIVERDEDGEAAEVSGFVFVVSVSDVAIVSPSINGCSDLDFILGDFVEETASSFSGDFSGYPISDCYKSHEEAQAALRREQDGE